VITTAAAHSHHSRRSIRRNFARRAWVCTSPVFPTPFGFCSRNNHLLARFSAQTSILFLHAIGQFQSESIARGGDVPKLLTPCKYEHLATLRVRLAAMRQYTGSASKPSSPCLLCRLNFDRFSRIPDLRNAFPVCLQRQGISHFICQTRRVQLVLCNPVTNP